MDRDRRSTVFDFVLAVVLTALLQANVWFGTEKGETFAQRPVSSVLMLLLTVPLIWRRERPVVVAVSNGLGRSVQALVTGSWVASMGIVFATLVAIYSVAAYASGRRAWFGFACVLAGLVVSSVYDLPSDEADLWNSLFFFLLTFSVFALGSYVRYRRRATELELRTERLNRERVAQNNAVAEERARIARELHDVIAHNVSATVIQAEAAEEVLDRSPERAKQSLVRIQRLGREALTEMRHLLGIMREESDEESAPQPRLSDLGQLIEDARSEGMEVTLAIVGEQRDLPLGIELSGYRIVQEALTNVGKHGGPAAKANVVLRYGDRELELEITDDGSGLNHGDEQGYGLIGMRERVAFFGGIFHAGPMDGGGFQVMARFPLALAEP